MNVTLIWSTPEPRSDADVAAITAAPADVAYLLAEVRRLRAEVEQAHEATETAVRLMSEHAREAGELRGERDWLRVG